VAVSGPGSVHPDDDFGSFASHRSTADDDEDDFGNFNAAPSAAGGAGPSGSAGAGPSGSGSAFGSGAGPSGSGGAGPSGSGAGGSGGAAGASGSGSGAASAWGGFAGAAAQASAAAGAAGAAGMSAASSGLSSAGLSGGAAGAVPAAGSTSSVSVPASEHASAEVSLLSLPAPELKAAVARALQPLLLGGLAGGEALVLQPPSGPQLAAAWAQLQAGGGGSSRESGRDTDPYRDGGDADADGSDAVAALSGIPMPLLPDGEGGKQRSYVPQVR
jgi:hypothetical protein